MRHRGLAETATPDGLRARRALLVEPRGLANVMESMLLATMALAARLSPQGARTRLSPTLSSRAKRSNPERITRALDFSVAFGPSQCAWRRRTHIRHKQNPN